MPTYSRAEIVLLDLGTFPDQVVGHEQANVRPCLVIQVLPLSQLAIVVPFTSRAMSVQAFPAVKIPAGVGGLTMDSYALCHQVRSTSYLRIRKSMGVLPTLEFEMVTSVLADFMNL